VESGVHPEYEVSEAAVQPASEVMEPSAPPELVAREAAVLSELMAHETAVQPASEALDEMAEAGLEVTDALDPPTLPEEQAVDAALPRELEQPAADALTPFDPLAFDEGAESFVVESLEPEPISLASFDVAPMDAEVDSVMDLAVDSMDDTVEAGSFDASGYGFAPGSEDDVIESVESFLADDSTVVGDAPRFESTAASDEAVGEANAAVVEHEPGFGSAAVSDDAAVAEDASAVAGIAIPGDSLEGQRTEIDPWEGADLPEPAFGSIGWPSSEIAALAAERPVEGVDEMSAALAWSDAEGEGAAAEHASRATDAHEANASGEDALSAMARELRDSSSAWVTDADVVDESVDVSARARFYGGGERINAFASDPDAASEASSYAAELAAAEAAAAAADAAGDDAGAAIADALARVAARIRAGEVDLPPEVVGTSDESALAAALAALLRGPRR
jgi:hypothetical protein